MNIHEALRRLELNGGYVSRPGTDIYWNWKTETWDDFLKSEVNLLIDDLTAIDWEHSK